jgi:signal transduction histidine kinase
MVYTDQFITRDIILPNLLKNAVNHGGKNTSITVGYRLRDGRQELYVRNTGSCFTNGDKKDMFEPFKKDPRSKGLGLGLNICKRYAELMGGYLRAESSGQPSDGNMQNAWAEFSLGFPVKP